MDILPKDNIRINLGGGSEKRDGWINIDIHQHPSVDIVCDIEKGIPFGDNTVVGVRASHFIEHIEDTIGLMREIWRVSKPGTNIIIRVPYVASLGAFEDPTHKKFFNEKSFRYFLPKNHPERISPEYPFEFAFNIKKIDYIWASNWMRGLPFKRFWKRYFWNIAKTMIVRLEVVK